jgi:YD repeat-containing protein
MELDPQSGILIWTPTSDQIGPQSVALHVTDSGGLTDSQSFSIQTRGVAAPPMINSSPITQAYGGVPYTYDVIASDPNGDPLTYSFAINSNANNWLSINSATGVISGTPAASLDGQTLNLTVTVANGEHDSNGVPLIATQAFSLTISNSSQQKFPPSITSTPPNSAVEGTPFTYKLNVNNQNNEALTYSANQVGGNSGTFSFSTAADGNTVLTWQNAPVGENTVLVKVSNADGFGEQTFNLDVVPHAAPIIYSQPVTTAYVGVPYQYDIEADDPGQSPVISASISPTANGFGSSANGQINYTFNSAGTYQVTQAVTDSFGTTTYPFYTLNVVTDTTPPSVAITTSPSTASGQELSVTAGATIGFQVAAQDVTGIASETLTVHQPDNNLVDVPLDENGFGQFTASETGTYTYSATVINNAGLSTTTSVVSFAAQSQQSQPITISNVTTFSAPITGATLVQANLSSTPPSGTTVTFTLTPPDGSSMPFTFTEVPTWSSNSSPSTLGTIDPTSVPDGPYNLTITIQPPGSSSASTISEDVDIESPLKLGDFSLSFNDLTISEAGIPITVTRSYSTLNQGNSGDFGYGWTLSTGQARLQTDVSTSQSNINSDGYPDMQQGDNVWITLPGGRREMFTFAPQPLDDNEFQSYGGEDIYTPAFVPGPGVTDTLSVKPVEIDETVDGTEVDGVTGDYNPADPEDGGVYYLTTTQGMVYTIDATTGNIDSVSDRDGNTLTYSSSQIQATGSDGSILGTVAIVRDADNRITQIIDPNSTPSNILSIQYTYDGNGNLSTVTDQDGTVTTYTYGASSAPAHYLTGIAKAGETLLQPTYTNGSLTGVSSPDGSVTLNPNPSQDMETVTNALGYTTTSIYDSNGNTLRTIQQIAQTSDPGGLLYSVTVMTYGQGGEPQDADDMTGQSVPFTETSLSAASSASPTAWQFLRTYDSMGDVLSSTDAMGQTTYYTYNPFGQLLTQTDPGGDTTTNVYDPATGNLLSSTDPDGNVTTYTYNSLNQLVETDSPPATPDGPVQFTQSSYNSNGFLYQTITGYKVGAAYTDQKITTYTDNGDGQTTATSTSWVNPNNVTRTVTTSTGYDSDGRETSSIDEYGNESITHYDALGNVDYTVDVHGATTTFVHDGAGNLLQTAYSDGTVTDNVYNSIGQLFYTDDRHVPGQLTNGTETKYDGMGRVIETLRLSDLDISVSGSGGSYSSALVSSGSVLSTSVTHYNSAGEVNYTISPEGLETQYAYNADGQQISVQQDNVPVWDPTTQANVSTPLITTYTYNAAGEQSSVTDALGDTTYYLYGGDGNVIKTTFADGTYITDAYDGLGNKTSETDAMGQTTVWKYNAVGELVEVDEPAVANPANGNALATPVTTYLYDNNGDEIAEIDADEQAAYQTWLGESASYQAAHPFTDDTRYTYDAFGNQLSESLPDSESESWSYDSFGREKLFTDFKGQQEAFKYDDSATGDGRLAGEYFFTPTANPFSGGSVNTSEASQSTVYTYNAIGQQQTVTDDSGTTTYSYNLDGMMTQEASPEGTITYVYNDLDQQIETYTSNTDIGYAYDVLGRLTTTTVDKLNGSTLSTSLVTMDYYDKDGNKAAEVNPAGVLTSYGYDALNRLTSVNESLGTTTIFSQLFTLNSDGLRIGATDMELQSDNSTVATITSAWTYDAMNRLLTETVFGLSDGADRFTDMYTYDLDSNRLSDEHVVTTTNTTDTTTYTYNGDNELTQMVDSVNGTTNYSYDANGSLTDDGAHKYIYDLRNKLVEITAENGTFISSYVYDDAGNRVKETAGTTTTFYLTDDNNPTGYAQPLEQRSSSTSAASMTYILGDHALGQVDGSGNISYYLTDGHGSTRVVTDGSGNVTATYNYDAFGTPEGFTPSATMPIFLYAGDAVYDFSSGLNWHGDGARDTSGFVFIQKDTYAGDNVDPTTLHEYLYAGADPINSADPSGHDETIAETEGTIGGLTTLESTQLIGYRLAYSAARLALFAFTWSPFVFFGVGVAARLIGSALSFTARQLHSSGVIVPAGTPASERGTILESAAGGNLNGNFPGADSDRFRVFQSIRTHDVSSPQSLLDAVQKDLADVTSVDLSEEIEGRVENGAYHSYEANYFVGHALTVIVPAENAATIAQPDFASRLSALAEEYDCGLQVIAYEGFEQ